MNKINDNNDVIPQTKTRKPRKPKPKHEFSEEAREGWQTYQAQREDNKILNRLNKKYSTKTQKRRQELKEKLLNNPIFMNDYKKILDAYNNNIKLDNEEIEILEIFEYKPFDPFES